MLIREKIKAALYILLASCVLSIALSFLTAGDAQTQVASGNHARLWYELSASNARITEKQGKFYLHIKDNKAVVRMKGSRKQKATSQTVPLSNFVSSWYKLFGNVPNEQPLGLIQHQETVKHRIETMLVIMAKPVNKNNTITFEISPASHLNRLNTGEIKHVIVRIAPYKSTPMHPGNTEILIIMHS